MATSEEMLEEVNRAIRQVTVLGQSVTMPGGTVVTRANISELYRLRERLTAEVEPEASGQAPRFVPIALGRVPG